MRNGQKPRREAAVEDVAPAMLPVASSGGMANLAPASADDLPATQLSLDSLDDPAEVLVHISSEALEGDEDLDGREDAEPAPAVSQEAAEAAAIVQVEPELPVEPELQVEPELPVEPELQVEPELPVEVEVDGAGAADSSVTATAMQPDEPAEPDDLVAADVVDVEVPGEIEAVDVADGVPDPQVAAAETPFEEEREEAEKDVQIMNRPIDASPEVDSADEGPAEEAPNYADVELHAQPMPYEPAAPQLVDDPALQIRLARIHLKTGSLTLARAELETLAGRHQLDTDAHLDLAESRWRTGDLQGAGEAAAAYLAAGGQEALGFLIAAEAAAMSNQHAEARRLVEQATERHLSELEPVFAGIKRFAAWGTNSWSAPQAVAPVEPEAVAPVEPQAVAPVEPEAVAPVEPEAVAPVEPEAVAPVELSPEVTEPAATEVPPVPPLAEPEVRPAANATDASTEAAAGRSYLAAGDLMMAALHFAVALRVSPDSAGAVLEAIGDRQELPLQLVRGDALQLLGLEADAGRAYQSVASALVAPKPVEPAPAPEPTPEPAPEPEPAAETAEPAAETAEPAPSAPEPSAKPSLGDLPPLRWD
jgi:outer membrane biosynthesis protein TonB